MAPAPWAGCLGPALDARRRRTPWLSGPGGTQRGVAPVTGLRGVVQVFSGTSWGAPGGPGPRSSLLEQRPRSRQSRTRDDAGESHRDLQGTCHRSKWPCAVLTTEDQATCAAGSHAAGAPSGVIHLTIEEQRARVTGKGGDGRGVGARSTEAQQASWDDKHGAATRSRGGAPTEPRGGEPAARRRLTSSHAGFSETFRMRARQGARSRPVPSLERRGCTAEVALKQQGAPPAPHGPAPRARALGAAAAGAPAVHGPLTDTPRLAGDTSSRPVGQGPGCGPVVLGCGYASRPSLAGLGPSRLRVTGVAGSRPHGPAALGRQSWSARCAPSCV